MLSTLVLMTIMTANSEQLQAGDHTRSIDIDGRSRSYIIHIPGLYNPKKKTPIVLMFHGGGSNAEAIIRYCGLNEKSDEAGFIVVYPQGTGRIQRLLTWNGGNCCGVAMRQKVDDVNFVRELLDDLATVVHVDDKRIFSTGMSNGAIMSYLLASELSDRIAAIAPVAGTMGTKTCDPQRPVSVMHFHGTADNFVPYEGGRGRKSISGTQFYSVEHSIDAWIKATGCPKKPTNNTEPDKSNDGITVTRKTYGPGKEGTEVVLFTIKGGGHTWPGKKPRLYFLGKSTKDISANDLMWEFFQKHPMK